MRRIDARLGKMEDRLRKVEVKTRNKRVAKAKEAAPEAEEELYVTDIFLPIMDVLPTWNDDRRGVLKDMFNVLEKSN